MNNLRIYISCLGLSLAAILAVSSCDSGSMENTIIKGHILEYGTEEPIEGAKVILLEEEASWTGGYRYAVDTITTDASGYYEYDFIEKAGFFYWIDVIKDGYHELPVPFYDFKSNQVNEKNILLDPWAALELHIKNVNPFDHQDRIHSFFAGNSPDDYYGMNIDTFRIETVRGNRDINLTWGVVKNGETTQYWDTIYCKGHELTKYELFY